MESTPPPIQRPSITASGASDHMHNADVLLPAHGGVAGVDVAGAMPVGSDAMFAVLSPG